MFVFASMCIAKARTLDTPANDRWTRDTHIRTRARKLPSIRTAHTVGTREIFYQITTTCKSCVVLINSQAMLSLALRTRLAKITWGPRACTHTQTRETIDTIAEMCFSDHWPYVKNKYIRGWVQCGADVVCCYLFASIIFSSNHTIAETEEEIQ